MTTGLVGLVSYMLDPGLLDSGRDRAMARLAEMVALGPFGFFEIPAWPATWAGSVGQALAGAIGVVCTQTTAIRDGWDAGAVVVSAQKRTRHQLAEAAELAAAIEAPAVAIWAGRTDGAPSAHRRALVETLDWLFERYRELVVVLEPFPAELMPGSWIQTARDALALCDEVGPRLQVLYDCAHEVVGGQPAVPAADVVSSIGTVQLTSPWWSAETGFEDRHPPFDTSGAITWDAARDRLRSLLAAGVIGPVSLEVKAPPGADADGLARRVRRWGEELAVLLAAVPGQTSASQPLVGNGLGHASGHEAEC